MALDETDEHQEVQSLMQSISAQRLFSSAQTVPGDGDGHSLDVETLLV